MLCGKSIMTKGQSTTTQKIFFKSKPQIYVLTANCSPHQCIIGDWSIRESYELLHDRTLPDNTVSYSIWIETEVSSYKEIWTKRDSAFELADDLNRVWTYVCGQPINAARLGLVICHAPTAWTTNVEEVEWNLQAGGLTGKVSIRTRHWAYCQELPLRKVLDILKKYKTAPDIVRELIEIHYLALTSTLPEARLYFFAKGLEIVRKLLPGKDDQEKQKSLPVDIASDLQQSLHWLFDMANNRSDTRHVILKKVTPPKLLPRMSAQERESFEHDADLFIRTAVCMKLGQEPFVVIHEAPT